MAYDTTRDERTWGMLAYLLNLIAPILGPLFLYFARKEESRFVAYHAIQSLYLTLAWILYSFLAVAVALFVRWLPVAGDLIAVQLVLGILAGFLAQFVAAIVGAVKAFNGEWFRIPVVGELALRQTGGPEGPGAGTAPPGPGEAPPGEAPPFPE